MATPTRLRRVWDRGECGVNLWLTNPSPFAAEALAGLGWDSVVIDMQHSPIDLRDALTLLTAVTASGADVTPLVRLPWNDPPTIMKVLDAGAHGVVCPMISTRADAAALIAACRYPPDGYRSFGAYRASLHGGGDHYFAAANSSVLAIAQVETAGAFNNLDELLSTPGLDGIYIGSNDLSISLGRAPGFDHTNPESVAITRTVLDAAARHGVKVGIHVVDQEDEAAVVGWGVALITPGNDMSMLTEVAQAKIAHLREAIASART